VFDPGKVFTGKKLSIQLFLTMKRVYEDQGDAVRQRSTAGIYKQRSMSRIRLAKPFQPASKTFCQ